MTLTPEQFNRVAREHKLTLHQRRVVLLVLAGRAAAPLPCYPPCVRMAVAQARELAQQKPQTPVAYGTV